MSSSERLPCAEVLWGLQIFWRLHENLPMPFMEPFQHLAPLSVSFAGSPLSEILVGPPCKQLNVLTRLRESEV